MKKLSLISLLMILVLGFSSCSEDNLLLEEPSGKLFEKVVVKRGLDGAYSLDYDLNKGVGSDVVKDENSTVINLFQSENETQRSFNEDLSLNGKDSFEVEISGLGNSSRIRVVDNDIRFNRSTKPDYLMSYEVTDNGDGTHDLKFSVRDGIETEFEENDRGEHRIHLTPGNGTQVDYLRTFIKEEKKPLKIIFAQHRHPDQTGRISASTEKPRIVIGAEYY